MRVLILGCGPAGLIAAHSAVMGGAEVRVLSKRVKSDIGGAQYLHSPIPDVNIHGPDGEVEIRKIGTEEGYAEKVYGDPSFSTSWKNYTDGELRPAWDLRKTYDKLWEAYRLLIHDMTVTTATAARVSLEYDLVISSIPARVLCAHKEHRFTRQKVLILSLGDQSYRDNLIVWNGDPKFKWYRWSKIFGVVGGYELPVRTAVLGAREIGKPLRTDCDCFGDIVRVGRYGQWNKDALTHEAYDITRKAMAERAVL